MKITDVQNKILKIPSWGATSILRPEKMLLRTSMLEYGWLQPIVVKSSDDTIIDGYQRYLISIEEEKFVKKYGYMVPVIYQNIDYSRIANNRNRPMYNLSFCVYFKKKR